MSDQFIGEIRMFSFIFNPAQWALCNGQLLAISSNTALYSLLGTKFGGDGVRTFALPDLGGNIPVCAGQGPGLSSYQVGQFGGSETITLQSTEIPSHSHSVSVSDIAGTFSDPTNHIYAKGDYVVGSNKGPINYLTTGTPGVTLKAATIASTGGGQAHTNLMPYLGLNFCIALQGIFPPRG
jgi:microcystin-dependent protein